jgi:hypothetical protein
VPFAGEKIDKRFSDFLRIHINLYLFLLITEMICGWANGSPSLNMTNNEPLQALKFVKNPRLPEAGHLFSSKTLDL